MTNFKGHIIDEQSFKDQVRRSDKMLDNKLMETNLSNEMLLSANEAGLVSNEYTFKKKIDRIPARWIRSYIIDKYGISTWKLFKDYILLHGWTNKNAAYDDKVMSCYEHAIKKL